MKYQLVILLTTLVFVACQDKSESQPSTSNPTSITEQISTNYELLPEGQISVSTDDEVFASYTNPTDIYGHGILGDKIEAQQLVVVVNGTFYELTLSDEFVFEDIRPRLYDVDGDNELEFITIRSKVSEGAGIVIYKIVDEQLVEYAQVQEIGTQNRWLNIVSIHDLDSDGIVELVWIQTPHIGGILKVANVVPGTLEVLDETSLYSNHAIGERNLCLSVLTETNDQKTFYVPNQNRDKIVGFTFEENKLELVEEIEKDVDFSLSLNAQYDFINAIEEENNCIFLE